MKHPIGHHPAVRTALGLPEGAKLPVEGMAPRIINGIKIWVEPLGPNPTKHKRSTHRVRAECPRCYKILSAGRLHQHVCKR